MMNDLSESADRLNALWRSGRSKFASFFSVLSDVQREIGPKCLDQWCIENLRLHISIIEKVSGILRDVDAMRERAALADARAAERERRKSDAALKREEREVARLRREEAIEVKEAKKAAQQKAARNEKRAQRREKRKQLILATPPPEPLAVLLEKEAMIESKRRIEVGKIETKSRIEFGEIYSAMKELVDTHQAGKDEDGKYWTWGRWAAAYIKRSRMDIHRCIAEFVTSGYNSRNDNVIHFTKNLA